MQSTDSLTGSGPFSLTMAERSLPSTYSMTMKWMPRHSSASNVCTMFGCVSFAAASTSRWNLLTAASSLVSAEGSSLIAARRFIFRC